MSRVPPVAVLLALLLASPAAAADEVVARATPVAGPVIAGRFVYWVQGGGTRPLVVRAAARGGRPQVALRIARPPAGSRRTVIALATGGQRVQLAYRTSPRGVPACAPHVRTAGFALAAGAVVSLVEHVGCAPESVRTSQVVVRRTGRPALAAADGTARLGHLIAGGRYVAWQQAGDPAAGDPVVVFDVVRGRVAYRVSDPALTLDHDQLALDDDGRLAASVFDPSASTVNPRYDVQWWAAGGKAAHQLPGLFATDRPIRFHAGRILFERPKGFGASELTLSDLAGRIVRIAHFQRRRNELLGFDYAGGTVAWAQRGPGGRVVILRTSVPAGTG